jgi:hypothetical protein
MAGGVTVLESGAAARGRLPCLQVIGANGYEFATLATTIPIRPAGSLG